MNEGKEVKSDKSKAENSNAMTCYAAVGNLLTMRICGCNFYTEMLLLCRPELVEGSHG